MAPELCRTGLVEMGEKEMLGEGGIRNKGSGMASGRIQSPPRTVWALIKWKVGKDAREGGAGWRGMFSSTGARHTAFGVRGPMLGVMQPDVIL